jgi:hypothetical protein
VEPGRLAIMLDSFSARNRIRLAEHLVGHRIRGFLRIAGETFPEGVYAGRVFDVMCSCKCIQQLVPRTANASRYNNHAFSHGQRCCSEWIMVTY